MLAIAQILPASGNFLCQDPKGSMMNGPSHLRAAVIQAKIVGFHLIYL